MRCALTVIIAVAIFLCGIYVLLNYGTNEMTEGFQARCPNVLIQKGNEIWLKNTKLADIPGVNPVVFHNLEEYTQFVSWQQSRGIECPALMLQKTFDAQDAEVFNMVPPPPPFAPTSVEDEVMMPLPPMQPLLDSTRDNPPFNHDSYPGMDPANQMIGQNTNLDAYGTVGETMETSVDPMDPNWGGINYSRAAVAAGNYKGDEVYKYSS
jgi:hypothetical protein